MLGLCAVGAATSGILLYEYLSPQGAFCGPGGGCDTVRTSAFASVAGIPLPAFGVLFFIAMGSALIEPRLRARRAPVVLGVAGGLAALVLLALQGAVIGAWCPYCVVVDLCAVGLGLGSLAPSLPRPGARVGWPGVAAVAMGSAVPIAIAVATQAPAEPPADSGPVPQAIAAAQVQGQVTIVEFVDFECPFCRRQHATLSDVLRDYGEQVEVVYRHLPLRIHEHAREAARVACCAEEQDMGKAAADALFATSDLSAQGCLTCAEGIGLDAAVLQDCLASDRPDTQLSAHSEQANAAGVRRLPTCFIGDQRLEGAQDEGTLRAAIERALATDRTST